MTTVACDEEPPIASLSRRGATLESYRRRAVTAYVALVLVAALALAGFLLHEYRQTIADGWERVTGRAQLAAQWIEATFSLSDMALESLAELNQSSLLVLRSDVVDPDYERLEQLLAERRDRFRFLDELGLFDAEGRVVVTSSPLFPRGYDLGGLPHYRIFREQPALDEWVSGLYWSSFANDYRIMHVRRLAGEGVLNASFASIMLTPQVFEEALSRLEMSRGESLALFDSEARAVSHRPCLTTHDCLEIGETFLFPEGVGPADAVSGAQVRLRSPVDGVERLYALAPVEGRPYMAVAGEAVEVLLGGWWERLWVLVAGWLLLALLGAAVLRHYLTRLGLEEASRIAATAFEGQQGMVITDAAGRILRTNRAFSRITGYPEAEVVGRSPSLLASGQHDKAFYRQMWQRVEQTGSWEGEVWNRRRSGEVYPERLTISAVRDDQGRVTHYVGSFSDISQQKAAEEEARQLALFDPLTGLPNRRQLLDRLAALASELLPGDYHAALLLIDLDHFRRVNDLMGHQQGDQLLQRITHELRSQLRESDTLSRLGGDEFAVLLEELGPDQAHAAYIAERIASKLLGALQLALPGAPHALQMTASLGITLFRYREARSLEVLSQADMALQQAKRGGRNRFCFFDPLLQAKLHHRLRLEADLRHALSLGQFQPYFQPQVDSEGHILGAEVLLRWEHPERGMVSPAEFIPLAEENRQIIAIDRWVLETACRQLAAWAAQPGTRDLTLAVNLSVQHFHETDAVECIRDILVNTGAPPARLKLEVTEGLFLEQQDEARQKMLALKALGVTFALDDFGTGFSSLSYLNRLPLDQLKIDQSFVRDVLEDPASASIVASTIGLAKSLDLEVIAEGVETTAQRDWLLSHGCRRFQGYLFGRPQPLGGFETSLRDARRALP
ncbi:bifunctional diguanylate cyclase/phosphodiesterase [Halomonas mongoliensis]|uniref:bifunctional diguanylate cyclase/phosphodiesterase n=1 Tax=Halomonas mongoliensis TaxID=321265 RepID=UPI00403A9ECA